MRINSKIFKKIAIFFTIFLLFIFALICFLHNGINIQNLDFKTFQIGRLYIKLDKKLILISSNIEVKSQNKNTLATDSFDMLNLTRNINLLNFIFSEIMIENLHYDDMRFDLILKDNVFFVDMPYLRLNAYFSTKDDKIIMDAKEIAFKDFNATIHGDCLLDIKSRDYDFNGEFISHEIKGNLRLKVQKNKLYYQIFDVYATKLENFMNEITQNRWIDKDIKDWIYGNVVAKEYFIQSLSGMADLKTKNMYLNDMQGNAKARNLKIKFDKNIQSIEVDDANISLKNGNLSFSLNNPTYYEKSLKNSNVSINDIFGKNTNIDINIQTNSIFDNKIHEILKAYDINIPIVQKNGKMDARLHLNIDLNDYFVKADGIFVLKDADIFIEKIPFFIKNSKIVLENLSSIKVQNSNLKNSFLDATQINAQINLDKNSAKFDFIADLNLKVKENSLIKFTQKPIHMDMSFEKNATILNINELNTKLVFSDLNLIKITNLSDFINDLPFIKDIGVKNADILEIKTKNFEDFDIDAKNLTFDLPLVDKNGTNYNTDSFKFKVGKDTISGSSKSDFVNFTYANSSLNINLQNIDFIYKDDEKKSSLDDKLSVNINGKNSNIILLDFNKTIPFDSYYGHINGYNIELFAKKADGNFHFSSSKDEIRLDAMQLDGEFVNSLFNSKSFNGGRFDLLLLGRNAKNYNAEIIIKDTYLNDYVFYHQLLTFLNTIPSLLVFKTPDFNSKGFTINDGKIYFSTNGDILNFKAINLMGTSADIGGHGIINLKTKQINIDLELKLLKDVSGIISKIPLVNQIILGKDRTLSTVIKISGTLDEPKYETMLLKDTFMTPFNIIKNTLELPFVIFD